MQGRYVPRPVSNGMKIVLAGGGTGGHFYPLIAIAEELNRITEQEHLINVKLYYMGDTPHNPELLREQFITYIPVTAGKLRVYFSLKNVVDIFKTAFGVLRAIGTLYRLYPDVVIGKGGYASFPTLFAARFLRIPVIIHESDTVPGRVNVWAGKFAKRIALSFPEAGEFFDEKRVSVTSQPVRKTVAYSAKEGAKEFFELDASIPTIGVFGGSQGAKGINDCITELLPQLIEKYQIIHQTGVQNFDDIKTDVGVILGQNVKRSRYKPFPYLNDLQTKMFGGACDIVIARAGSSIFEIAAWGKPSILIPYPLAHGDHQKKNAYHFARAGAAIVIQEENLTASILLNEIELILDHKDRYDAMATRAKALYNPDAARLIAREAIALALEHER